MNRQLLLTAGCRASLRNEYVALRRGRRGSQNASSSTRVADEPSTRVEGARRAGHGWSKANEAGVIVSRIENGARPEYGLHATGRRQAEEAAAAFARRAAGRAVSVYASDFSRTLETAEIAANAVGAGAAAAFRRARCLGARRGRRYRSASK